MPATTIALWVGLIAGCLYIAEFVAVRIFKPLRKSLRGRSRNFWSTQRAGGAVIVLAGLSLAFVDGSPRIILAGTVVAAFVVVNVAEYRSWRSGNQSAEADPPSPATASAGEPHAEVVAPAVEERDFIARTPEEIWRLFDGRTQIQAQGEIEALIGKWMTHSGEIRSVGEWTGYFCQVTFRRSDSRAIYMMFSDKGLLDRLSALKGGDRVTVRGRISRVDIVSIQLDDCELGDVVEATAAQRVMCALSPMELTRLYARGATEAQGATLVAAYKGQWRKVSATVDRVTPQNDVVTYVMCHDRDETTVTFFFEPTAWASRLRGLMPNDRISVVGTVKDVTGTQVIFDGFELIRRKRSASKR